MLWPNVEKYRDGDQLNAATLNDPIDQLIARTEYLKQALSSFADRANVAVADAALAADALRGKPQRGQPVYRVPGGNAYARAAAVVDGATSQWFWADHQAMAVGVVGSTPSGDSATVVLSGYVRFDKGIPVADVIADANPQSGRYFLSAKPGMLTAAPTGPVIYVCDCEIADVTGEDGKTVRMVKSMLVNPQYRDTGESHVHRTFVLSGAPLGGYSVKTNDRYHAPGILDGASRGSTTELPAVALEPCGHWAYDGSAKYTVSVGGGTVTWNSDTDGSGSAAFPSGSGSVPVGTHGLRVRFTGEASAADGKSWSVDMPDAARAWADDGDTGFRLNLGMYPELARFVPDPDAAATPVNGLSLTVDGADRKGPAFGDDRGWYVRAADGEGSGPWLVWVGGAAGESEGVSATAPFVWDSDAAKQRNRAIVLYANRMRVGPTGFVTSLQAAPGSPLKVTSAQTGATAFQGALQVGLDVDFKSGGGDAAGAQVVKRIEGSTFVTGPVVERIVAGPGIEADRQQGTVTVSVSNAVYAGDFETIALRNAKQDLAGGVFPYTKLLPWTTGGTGNVRSGFTAKFRVPDFIPYNAGKGYYVVVSASVFGEAANVETSARSAVFTLGSYMLADQACSAEAPAADFYGSIAGPFTPYKAPVAVPFASGYGAFDPVLVHGFSDGGEDVAGPGALALASTAQRVRRDALWLQTAAGVRMVVYPGYFVGVSVERDDVAAATEYPAAIGFLSLRWNLVAVS